MPRSSWSITRRFGGISGRVMTKGHYRWPFRPRRDILRLLKPGTLVISGHTHRPFQTMMDDGWRNIGVGTCCAPWRNGPRTYGVLEISPKAIVYTEKPVP